MVALDSMSITEYLTRRMAMAASRRRERSFSLPRTWLQTLVRLVLHIAGFSCFTIAAFSVSLPAGLAVAGLSCFCMSYLATRQPAADTTPSR